jgi:hypothetical protein
LRQACESHGGTVFAFLMNPPALPVADLCGIRIFYEEFSKIINILVYPFLTLNLQFVFL